MLKAITFEVVGDQQLMCEGCEQRVERALTTLQGVNKVRATARNQRIEVLFDTTRLDAAALADQISRAGYQSRVVNPTSA